MKTRLVAILALSLVLDGCIKPRSGSDGLAALTNDLNDLIARKAQDPPAVETELAALARRAQLAAKGEGPPGRKVATYRIAAIAAWQAGAKAGTKALEIRTEGEAACGALQLNEARPTDCAVISLVAALAVADDLQNQLDGLKAKYRDATLAHKTQCEIFLGRARQICLDTRAKLPQSDGDIIKDTIFPGFRGQYESITSMRAEMGSLAAVDDSLKQYTDTQRLILYCSALTSLSLLQDCQGSAASVSALTPDLTSMQCRLSKPKRECEAADPAALPGVDCSLEPPNDAAVLEAKDS